jgi:hypothetical protein
MANPYEKFHKPEPKTSSEDRIRSIMDEMRQKGLERQGGDIKLMPNLKPQPKRNDYLKVETDEEYRQRKGSGYRIN